MLAGRNIECRFIGRVEFARPSVPFGEGICAFRKNGLYVVLFGQEERRKLDAERITEGSLMATSERAVTCVHARDANVGTRVAYVALFVVRIGSDRRQSSFARHQTLVV